MGSRKENPGETLAPAEVPREIEMKLSIAPDTIGSVLAHPLLAKARRSPDHAGVLDATYFDTEERDLCRAGFSLRIRRQGDRRIQTLKFLLHLCAHASFHLGQAGYLRRALTGDTRSAGPVPLSVLTEP